MDTRFAKKALGVTLIAIALIAAVLAIANLAYGRHTDSGFFSRKTYRIQVSGAAKQDLGHLIRQYKGIVPTFNFKYSSKDPDIIIDSRKRSGLTAALIEGMPALELKAGTASRLLREKRDYWFMARMRGFIFRFKDRAVSGLEGYLKDYYAQKPGISLNAVGDILPGRHVAQRMAEHDVNYPFEKIAPCVSGADIVFGDLECPLTDRYPAPTSGMTFLAPSKTIEGIKLLGLNVAALANNHSTNFGREAFVDTLNLLKANNIKYTGGGMNYAEAHQPAIMDVGGVKIAFLDYNSITGSIDATPDKPGVSWISMPPWYPENEQQIATALEDIRLAKEHADVVIASFHWSQEDVYYPSQSMKNLAHGACDAGADMVIGSHPHSIQPLEYYNGKFIAYSMGNFVFDQMQRDQTREGFFIKCRFTDSVLTGLELVPYKIYDYSQPRPFQGDSGQYLLDHVFELSGW